MKYAPDFAPVLHVNKLHAALEFLPEFLMHFEKGTPKLTLIVEFEGNSKEEVDRLLMELNFNMQKFKNVHTKIPQSHEEQDKDWAIRRESFNLLRKKLTNYKACPFIDDTCVDPKVLPEFLPKLYAILDKHHLLYSIAGHIGNGNFHIFPLLDMRYAKEREKIFEVTNEYIEPLVITRNS